MQVVFESHDPEAARLRQQAVVRMLVAMRHISWLVPRVRVQLSRSGSARHGPNKRCSVELESWQAKPVAVTSIAKDWTVALERALARAIQTLRRGQRGRAQPQGAGAVAQHHSLQKLRTHDATRNAWTQLGRRLLIRSIR